MEADATISLVLQVFLDQAIENTRTARQEGPFSVDEIYGLLMMTAPVRADFKTATYLLALALDRLAPVDPLK